MRQQVQKIFALVVSVLFVVTLAQAEDDHYHPPRVDKSKPTKAVDPVFEKLNAAYWGDEATNSLSKRFSFLQQSGWASLNKDKKARNVILVIGDGMGITTITAMRKLKQEKYNLNFYESKIIWDTFPFSGISRTYDLDEVIADSAATATAYLTGAKTRDGWIGIDGTADLDCATTKGYIDSIAHWAVQSGKVSGLVTTTPITHASPSPLYANIPYRDFQYYTPKYVDRYPTCTDIAQQFVNKAQHIKVAMGGGIGYFTPSNFTFEVEPGVFLNGSRTDGRNLVEEWLADRGNNGARAKYISTLQELLAVKPNEVDYLLGLFADSSLQYYDDKPAETQPRLQDMAEAAINILNKHDEGYFLFLEGGRIDHGHHDGVARYALTEGLELDLAVQKVLSMVDLSETLIVITADHSHTLTLGGYMHHEDSVLGLASIEGSDGKPFTSLAYANGRGAALAGPNGPYEGTRPNITGNEHLQTGYLQQATVPLSNGETHGGEDVMVYATGVHAEYFTGIFEESYIPWAMACASGIQTPSNRYGDRLAKLCSGSSSLHSTAFFLVLSTLITHIFNGYYCYEF